MAMNKTFDFFELEIPGAALQDRVVATSPAGRRGRMMATSSRALSGHGGGAWLRSARKFVDQC